MVEAIQWSLAFLAGVALGGCYFAGLWWTVRRLNTSHHFLRMYVATTLARFAIAVAAFYLIISYLGWQAVLASLLGFVASRLAIVRFVVRQSVPSPERTPGRTLERIP